jgi:hypothetical protein
MTEPYSAICRTSPDTVRRRSARTALARPLPTWATIVRSSRTRARRSGEGGDRPPLYHRATRREARASKGSSGHENPGSRRNQSKMSSRAWTRMPAQVFPQCSLAPLRPRRSRHRRSRIRRMRRGSS